MESEALSCTFDFGEDALRIITPAYLMIDGEWQKFNALWDTGSDLCRLSRELFAKHSFEPAKPKLTHSHSGVDAEPSKACYCDLLLPNGAVFPHNGFLESDLSEEEFDIIIGMDVIIDGDMAISNYENHVVFTFRCPSQGKIDFKDNPTES